MVIISDLLLKLDRSGPELSSWIWAITSVAESLGQSIRTEGGGRPGAGLYYNSWLITSLTTYIKTKQTAAGWGGSGTGAAGGAPSFLESVSLIYVMRRYALSPNI